jgi:DNA-binding GntR family transcriptional regulator
VAGEFHGGSALAEIPLAKEIGISRTPVREAISQLVAEGILHETAGRGAAFIEPNRREIIELYELREALEVYAVRKAARQGISRKESETLGELDEEIRNCRLLLEKSRKTVLGGQLLERFLAADLRFHVLLLQSAGNERIAKAAANTRLLIRIFTLRRQHHTTGLLNQVEAFHREILEAVRRGDAEQAGQVLGEHIRLSLDERLAEYANPLSVQLS